MTEGTPQVPPTPGQAPPAPPQAPQAPPQQPQKKGLSPLAWVGIGCGVLILVIVVVLVAGGLFFVHKVKQAGISPELWAKNPALAASKMITVVNPDLKVVKVDEDKGLITIRDTKSGKIVTLNLKDVEKGHIDIRAIKNGKTKTVTITAGGEGKSGSVKITNEEGKTIAEAGGGSAAMPSWLAAYPGAAPAGHFSSRSDAGVTGSFIWKTAAPVDQVISFYRAHFMIKGFKVTGASNSTSGKTALATLSVSDKKEKRTAQVSAVSDGGTTTITVTFEEPAAK
ncbi:MAG: hypothetical protein GXP48_08920 [Acidobacteria bacterium]|nr:hypothetical protein [Acidobacteriota bacterium]